MLERHNLPVHLGPDTMIPDCGMYSIGKIYRGRSSRQFFHDPFGREHIDHIVEEVELHRVHELPVIRQILLPFDELMQPSEGPAVTVGNVSLFFILPVRGDAMLGYSMHLLRADLEFDMLSLRTHHRCMQRLIEIRLWNCDVVLETARHRTPG